MAAECGASSVLITDLELIVNELIQPNIERWQQGKQQPPESEVEGAVFDWSCCPTEQGLPKDLCDLCMFADCIFDNEVHSTAW